MLLCVVLIMEGAIQAHADSPEPRYTDSNWPVRAQELRAEIAAILRLPSERVPLDAHTHRTVQGDGWRAECVTYAAEPSSRVTALLWLPDPCPERVPGIVLCAGHGGSKAGPAYQYAGQLYAKLGYALLMPDTIGEEERHHEKRLGTRAHDMPEFGKDSPARREFTRSVLKRMVLGKLVWDLMRGMDYLESREEVDPARLGVMGNSLGGCTAGCLSVLDPRIKASVISGWGFCHMLTVKGKDCTSMPYEAFARCMDMDEMTALLFAPTLFINGEKDTIMDTDEGGARFVRQIRAGIAGAQQILSDADRSQVIRSHFVPDACHRPYFLTRPAAEWLAQYLMPAGAQRAIPEATVRFGDWATAHGVTLEKLYDTDARQRGTAALDIGAVCFDAEELACFPGESHPGPEYTWTGWVESVTRAEQP